MRRLLLRGIGVILLAALICPAGPAAQSRASTLFAFTTNDFWLNLHHYLYVLGSTRRRMPDATQPAVASAPDDERQGRPLLTDDERSVWDEAVTAYANGLSQRNPVFQPPLAPMTITLANTGDVMGFPVQSFDAAARDVLEKAATAYRKGWWGRHPVSDARRRVRELAGRLLIHRPVDGSVLERQFNE